MAKFVAEQFTIKSCIRGRRVSKLFLAPTIGELYAVLQTEAQEHHSSFDVSDSFTVVGRVAQRATSFEVAEHGHLTEHVML